MELRDNRIDSRRNPTYALNDAVNSAKGGPWRRRSSAGSPRSSARMSSATRASCAPTRLARFRAHRSELVEPKIAEYEGRIVKLMGDGLLVEFASVVNAVRCATDFQRVMAARNDGVPEEEQIVLRVGINLGDVIVEGEDIHGDGVNVATRRRLVGSRSQASSTTA